MEVEIDEDAVKAAGAKPLTDGGRGLRIRGWEIESRKLPILNSHELLQWEKKLQTSHFPEMIFGNSCLILRHEATGTVINFNAFDALTGWKEEALPPVEVPAAAKWKFRSKPFQEVILDYDYTFTTPYCGSKTIDTEKMSKENTLDGACCLKWEDTEERIDLIGLAAKEPILFYDELRVDGVLMRLRDTRMHGSFADLSFPVLLRENCWREATFDSLAAKGYPVDAAAYGDPSSISQRLPIGMHKTQKLKLLPRQ